MRRRRALRVLLLCAALLALRPGTAHAGEKVVFSFDNRITSLDLMLAVERGYFTRQGIDVESSTFNSSSANLPLLAKGSIDVAPSGGFGSAYFNVIQRGAGVRFVAARSVHRVGPCDYTVFVARRGLVESGRLTDFASLRGLRIQSDRTAQQYYYVSRLLELGGLRPEDVEMVNIPSRMTIDALARNLVDISIAVEPLTQRIVSTGVGAVWKPFSAVAPDQQSTFLLFGTRLLGERRDLGRKVIAGWLEAVHDIRQEGMSDRNVELVSRLTHTPESDVRQLCWPQWSDDGRIDPVGLEDRQRFALSEGLIERISPFSELVDDGFLPPRP